MPKISYLQTLDNGTDTTEVTQAVIEQKIANIDALLHGRIDKDNLLSYQDGTVPLQINPGVISDMPNEFKPVNHSMKFFANGNQDLSVKEKSWDKIIEIADNNPAFHTIGGIQDGEMLWEFSSNEDFNFFASEKYTVIDSEESESKTKRIEVPPNYVPANWEDIYNLLNGEHIKVSEVVGEDDVPYFKVGGEISSLAEFESQMGVSGDSFVQNVQVQRTGSFFRWNGVIIPCMYIKANSFPDMQFSGETNEATWDADMGAEHIEIGFSNVRLIVSALFRVLP